MTKPYCTAIPPLIYTALVYQQIVLVTNLVNYVPLHAQLVCHRLKLLGYLLT
jgi:hypothetical protein